jgi:CDP-4-dehydro-6-deoxyglucose reductase, E3
MMAMTILSFEQHRIEMRPGETVLQALCRNRLFVPYYCQVGSCKTCVVRVLDGAPPADSQLDLMPEQIARKCFLACVAIPRQDLSITRAEELA